MSDPGAALHRVARGDLCTGCGACAALSPAVRMSAESGFLRPVVAGSVSAEENAAIATVCPGLGLDLTACAAVRDTPRDDVLWGPLRRVATGHATDPALRHEGASGGGLSALAAHLLESGTVDFVLQIAADPENPLGNRTVLSRTRADVLAAAGSRYAPSAPLDGIGRVIDEATARGETGAFIGKPCDAAALRALAARDPAVARVFPHVLSFFCAGVPNRKGAEAVVRALGMEPAAVTAFRYRGQGWPGRAKARTRDANGGGREASMSYHDSWGGILANHVQFRCKLCPDGIGSFADLVAADAWETDAKGYPLFEERPGESLLVARTAAGEALLEAAVAAGALTAEPLDADAITAMQPGQSGRRRLLAARLAGLRLSGRPVPRYRGFHLAEASRQAPFRLKLRNALGTLRRSIRGAWRGTGLGGDRG